MDACCSLTTTSFIIKPILLRTNHWNVPNFWTTCIEMNRTRKEKQNKTMTIIRAQFPGKVQGIFHADSVMALNSHPVSNYHWVFDDVTRHGAVDREMKTPHDEHKTNSDSSAVCCDFAWMPTAPWQNWMTAQRQASGAQGSLKTQRFNIFFLLFYSNIHGTCQCL